jgi:hypothetical protein
MFDLSPKDVVMESAVGEAAERSDVGSPTAAGDRSIASRSSKTATEHDRRQSLSTNPNSRQSRAKNDIATSSYPQEWNVIMTQNITTFLGIDVSKDSLDLCLHKAGAKIETAKKWKVAYDKNGIQSILKKLPEAGTCLGIVEATVATIKKSSSNSLQPTIISRSSIREKCITLELQPEKLQRQTASMHKQSPCSANK